MAPQCRNGACTCLQAVCLVDKTMPEGMRKPHWFTLWKSSRKSKYVMEIAPITEMGVAHAFELYLISLYNLDKCIPFLPSD